MKTPIQRIRNGSLILAAIVLAAILGFRLLGKDFSWLDALWLTVVTISSVGYAEHSDSSPQIKIFTIAVIVLGMSAAAYTLGGFIQLMAEGEIERLLGVRRMNREIGRLRRHVVICGFGRMGRVLAEQLQRQSREFVVIETDAKVCEEAQEQGCLVFQGDATDDDVLASAQVPSARTLVTVLPNDAANVFITLTARNLSGDLQIIARADLPTSEKKLRQAGADKVIMPTVIGAQQMARMITRPTTADLMEVVAESGNINVELDELELSAGSRLSGMTVRESEAHRRHRMLILAVKQVDHTMVFNPEADYRFSAGEIIIVMGRADDLRKFREQFGL